MPDWRGPINPQTGDRVRAVSTAFREVGREIILAFSERRSGFAGEIGAGPQTGYAAASLLFLSTQPGGSAEGLSPRPPAHIPKARRALTRSWTARANWLCVPSSWPMRTSTKAWMAVFQGTVFMTGPPWRKRPADGRTSGPDGCVSCHDSRRRGQAHTAGHTQASRRLALIFSRTIGRRNLVARSPPLRTLEEPAPIDSSSRSMKPVIRLGQVPGDGFPATGHDGSGRCLATPAASQRPPPAKYPPPFWPRP